MTNLFNYFSGIEKQSAYKILRAGDRYGGKLHNAIMNLSYSQGLPPSSYKSSMRYADLGVPLKTRLAMVVGEGDPQQWIAALKRDPSKFREYKTVLGTPSNVKGDYYRGYVDYLRRAFEKDPTLQRKVRRYKQLETRENGLRGIVDNTPSYKEFETAYKEVMTPLQAKFNEIREMDQIPTITVYTANKPFPTTHHMASGELSRKAIKAAEGAEGDFIPSVTGGPTYVDHYNEVHRINRPGSKRTPEELAHYQKTDTNIGSSPDYEATFIYPNLPSAKAVYTVHNPVTEAELGVKAIAPTISAKTLQSADRGTLYKGRQLANNQPPHAAAAKASKALEDVFSKILNGKVSDFVLNKIKPASMDVSDAGQRWYTPWSHLSSGYAVHDLDAPLIRLNGNQINKLRKLYKANTASFDETLQAISASSEKLLRENMTPETIRAIRAKTLADLARLQQDTIRRQLPATADYYGGFGLR